MIAPPQISPSAFFEQFVENNKELAEKLEQDKDFIAWYQSVQLAEQNNAQANVDFLHYMLENDPLPGEQPMGEYSYFDTNYNGPLTNRIKRNAGRTEAARLIKNKRRLQMTEYSRPSHEKKVPGLHIRFRDTKYKPTEIEKESLRHYNNVFVDNCFMPAYTLEPNMHQFMGEAYDDFFDLDDISIEIGRTVGGKPLRLHMTDPASIFHVRPTGVPRYTSRWDKQDVYNKVSKEQIKKAEFDNQIRYVWMVNNQRKAAFTKDFMIKSHFFTSTDASRALQGFSIVEQGIRMLLNIMNSMTYNSTNFSNNRTPMGMLALTGGFVNRVAQEQFKKILYAYLGGAAQRHKLPVIGLPERGDAKFIPFNMNSREMEFHLWMTLLFTILCQLSGTNPEEISFSSHESAMTGKKLFDQAPDGILQISRDQGLNTFLRYFADIINRTGFLRQMTGYDVICEFNGLEVEDEKVKVEVQKSKLATTHSYNDLMRENGDIPQTLMFGDKNIYDIKAVDSPVISQVLQTMAQAELEKAKAMSMAATQGAGQQQGQDNGQGGGQTQGQLTGKDADLALAYGEAE